MLKFGEFGSKLRGNYFKSHISSCTAILKCKVTYQFF